MGSAFMLVTSHKSEIIVQRIPHFPINLWYTGSDWSNISLTAQLTRGGATGSDYQVLKNVLNRQFTVSVSI